MTTVDFEYHYEFRDRGWPNSRSMIKLRKIFDDHFVVYETTLRRLSSLEKYFGTLQLEGDASQKIPFWNNMWLPPLDAISLAGLIALYRPSTYVEVGSGNSTKFARWMVDTLSLATKIVSIDPFPRAEIDAICDVTIRSALELADLSIFFNLAPNDIVFIDNSHRSFPSSDVTVFFTEILPNLPHDVIFGLHDIFLPFDYPPDWKERFYNEQYLLASYLYGGGDRSKHVIATHYMDRLHPSVVRQHFPLLAKKGVALGGGAFFMKRFQP